MQPLSPLRFSTFTLSQALDTCQKNYGRITALAVSCLSFVVGVTQLADDDLCRGVFWTMLGAGLAGWSSRMELPQTDRNTNLFGIDEDYVMGSKDSPI